MRTIAIDFNNPIEYENMVIGNIGEHNATEIILTPPSKIADCEAVKSYIVAFVVGGMVIHSEPFSKTETLSVKLWRQLTEEPVMGIQLEAYDENENFIGKSELISSLRLSPSACGNDTVADTDNPDILSAIAANTSARHSHSNKSVLDRITRANMEDVAANTAARHTHENADVLGKFGENNGVPTYNGKPVGGGGERATADVSFTQEWSDFLISTDTTSKKVSITVNSDSLTTETEIKSISVLFEGQQDYIDLRDLTLHINEDCEPCTVAYHHPSIDEGESGFAGLRVAALYFPMGGNAYQLFNNYAYSAVKIVYYTEG